MFKLTRRLRLQGTVVSLGLLVALAASAEQPDMPQGSQEWMMGGGMPEIPNTELTAKAARASIDAYLALRKKYGNKAAPEGDAQAFMQGMQASAEVNAIVTSSGFKDAREWQDTITSVVLAHNFIKKGNWDEMDTQIAEIEANSQIPAAFKQQLVQRLKSVRPSDNNMKIVQQLLDDPTYSAKITDITK